MLSADLNCPAAMLSPVNRLFLASRRFSRSFLSSFYTQIKSISMNPEHRRRLHLKVDQDNE